MRRGRSRKLSAQWVGPYTITDVDKVNATIARGRKSTKIHIFINEEEIVSTVYLFVTDED